MIEQSSNAKLLTVHDDLNVGLLGLAHLRLKEYKFQHLIAASFLQNNTIIAWFNNQGYHTAALALNLVHNAVTKQFFGNDFGISVTNAPMKFVPNNDTDSNPIPSGDYFGYLFSIVIGLEMTMLSASYITFYIKVCK